MKYAGLLLHNRAVGTPMGAVRSSACAVTGCFRQKKAALQGAAFFHANPQALLAAAEQDSGAAKKQKQRGGRLGNRGRFCVVVDDGIA